MPNWCYSSYVVTGDEKEVCDLYEKMKSLEDREESLVENGFGKSWLGNIVTLLGGDWEKIYCRGDWFNLEKDDDDGALRFDTETAWNDPDEVVAFLKKHYPSLEFYFIAEESGNGYFFTNDTEGEYFPEIYSVLPPDSGEEHRYEEGEEREFFDEIAGLTGREINSMDDVENAVMEYNEAHEDEYIFVKIFRRKATKHEKQNR